MRIFYKGLEAVYNEPHANDVVADDKGNILAHIVHDECCSLWYVGEDLSTVDSFAGCGDTLEEAFADWVLGKSLGRN
jgi:hypothetical protein